MPFDNVLLFLPLCLSAFSLRGHVAYKLKGNRAL